MVITMKNVVECHVQGSVDYRKVQCRVFKTQPRDVLVSTAVYYFY